MRGPNLFHVETEIDEGVTKDRGLGIVPGTSVHGPV